MAQLVTNFKNKKRGFSLVELLVAIAMLLVFISAITGSFLSIKKQLSTTGNKDQAILLAEEGLEAARNIRDRSIDFSSLPDGNHGLDVTSGSFEFSGTSDLTDKFTRILNITTINANQKEVTSTVSWSDQISPSNSVVLKTYLTNWRAPLSLGLTVDKVVVNHGGTKVPSDFLPYNLTTQAWDNTVYPPVLANINIPIIFAPSVMNNLAPGVYTFLTSSDPDYNLSLSSACTGNSISLANGDSKVCTITYEEIASSITINKVVINHGSTKVADDFLPLVKLDGSPILAFGTQITVSNGSHVVSETSDPSYTTTFSGDCDSSGNVTLTTGQSKTCTITNEEKLAYVTVNKTVINHGGSKVASNFAPFKVGTTTVSNGVSTAINSGTYTVTETTDPDYSVTFSGDCNSSGSVTLVAGTSKVCNITNEEKNATITVNKNVINHGGSKVASNFAPFMVGTNTVTLGAATNLPSGTYTVSETTDPNYNVSFSGDCNSSGSVTLTAGSNKTCTITNEEKLAYVTVNKTVINHGGSKVASNFAPFKVGTTTVSNGVSTAINSGTYTVTETTDPDYSVTFSGDCNSSGSVTLVAGTSKVCNITNEETTTIPTVTTTTPTGINTTFATGGGDVTYDGGATVTARGVVWSTSINPTIALPTKTIDGSGVGAFTSSITGLTSNTLYHVRAYATNSVGTAYGSDITFTTLAPSVCPLVGTPTVYDSASSNSAVVSKPTGVVEGDIMFAHILHFNATDRLTTIPTGWIQIGRHKNGSYNQALYYKVAGASEGASYTFGFTSNPKVAVTISAYRGCFNTSDPIDTYSNTEYVVSNTTYRAASMTLSSAYTTVLMFPSVYSTSARTFSNPTTQSGGWTEDYDHGNTNPDFWRAGYRKMINTAGATGVIDSIGTLSGTTIKHAFAVALHPW